jgi:hypothetical protein
MVTKILESGDLLAIISTHLCVRHRQIALPAGIVGTGFRQVQAALAYP